MGDRGRNLKQLDRILESSHRLTVASPAPLVQDDGGKRLEIAEALVSFHAPGSFAADQYRTIRLCVERLRQECGLHALGVTSPTPGDGKTITTLNLAGALAQGDGARVLVVDADLRRPSVAAYLGLGSRSSPGLADAILDSAYGLGQVVRRLDAFNLSVIPAGAPQASPYELLNSPRLESLLKEARGFYDCVLIDTPPLIPLPDGRLIGRYLDGFLLIVGAHKTPRKLVVDALNLLDPAKVIGVVFNGDDQSLSSHYGYYHYYYYMHEDDRDAGWWRRVLTLGRRGGRQRSSR